MFVPTELAVTWDQKCLTIFRFGETDYLSLNQIGNVMFGHKTLRQISNTIKITIGLDKRIDYLNEHYITLEDFNTMWKMLYFAGDTNPPPPIMQRYSIKCESIGKTWYDFIRYRDLMHDVRVSKHKKFLITIAMYRTYDGNDPTNNYVMVPYYNNEFCTGDIETLFNLNCYYEHRSRWEITIGVGMVGALASIEIFETVIATIPFIYYNDNHTFTIHDSMYKLTTPQFRDLMYNALINAFTAYDNSTRQPVKICKILPLYKVYQNKNSKTTVVTGVPSNRLFGNDMNTDRMMLNVFKDKHAAKEAIFSATNDTMRYINSNKLNECIVGYAPVMFQLTPPIDNKNNKLTRVTPIRTKSDATTFVVCHDTTDDVYVFISSPTIDVPNETLLEMAGHDMKHTYESVFRAEYSIPNHIVQSMLEDGKEYLLDNFDVDIFDPDMIWFSDKNDMELYVKGLRMDFEDSEF